VTTITSWGQDAIYTYVPSGATTGNIVVTVGGVASNSISYTVLTSPNILTIRNTSNVDITSATVGTAVRVLGGGFGTSQGGSTVTFNGTAATPTNWTADRIDAPIPSGATSGNIVVTVSSTASNNYSFTVTPTISSLSTTSGPVGASVTINGTGFGSTKGSSTVTFNGTAVTSYGTWSATAIPVTVPTGATTGNVVVTVGGVASNGVTFTVTTAPAISNLSPASGIPNTTVTITGTNLGTSGTVTFNGTVASTGSWTSTSISATVPDDVTTGNVVVTVSGQASNGVSFTVQCPNTGAGVFYYLSDVLGSSRIVTDASGVVCNESDFYPYGGERVVTTTLTDHYKFTGKERDGESGLDNFGARYDSSWMGRFMSPDPENMSGFDHMDDPQGWNGYAYARNNPLVYVDPDGMNYRVCEYDDDEPKNCRDISDDDYDQWRKDNQNLSVSAGGSIYAGNNKIGSAYYYNEKVGEALQEAGARADVGVKAAMIATAPTYLAAAGAFGAVELAGQAATLSVFGRTAATFSQHALRHLPMTLRGQAQAAIETAIQSGRIGYVTGGTFVGRVIVNGKELFFSGTFREGVAQVGRIASEMRESLRAFVP